MNERRPTEMTERCILNEAQRDLPRPASWYRVAATNYSVIVEDWRYFGDTTLRLFKIVFIFSRERERKIEENIKIDSTSERKFVSVWKNDKKNL